LGLRRSGSETIQHQIAEYRIGEDQSATMPSDTSGIGMILQPIIVSQMGRMTGSGHKRRCHLDVRRQKPPKRTMCSQGLGLGGSARLTLCGGRIDCIPQHGQSASRP